MYYFFLLLDRILEIYSLVIIVGAVLSWLVAFGVINTANEAAQKIIGLIGKVTEPIYVRIRKVIPPMSGFDLSPIILLVAIWIVEWLLIRPFLVPYYYG